MYFIVFCAALGFLLGGAFGCAWGALIGSVIAALYVMASAAK